MPDTKAQIAEDLKTALKSRDGLTVSILRLLLSDIHNLEIAKKGLAGEDEVLAILRKSVKKHEDSISQFRQGNRPDLADKEEQELKLIKKYLPEPLAPAELLALVEKAVAKTGASGPKDFGKVMKELMPKIQGRAEGSRISELVKSQL